MNKPETIKDNQAVVQRFFEAIDYLIERGIIGGRSVIAERYGIDRRNLGHLHNDPSRKIFNVAWLTYLVNDYSISAEWLLCGKGNISKLRPRKNATQGEK